MAIAPESAATDRHERDFDAASLVRTASWGIGAAAALFVAVLAGMSDSGSPRVAAAVETLTGKAEKATAPKPAQAPPPIVLMQPRQPQQPNLESRRLIEQMRLLAADRDRLAQRVGALERNLEDVTGSVRRQEEAAAKAAQSPEPPAETATLPVSAAPFAVAAAPWLAIPPELPTYTLWTPPPEPSPETTAALAPAAPLPRPPTGEAIETRHAADASAAEPEVVRQVSLPAKPEQRPSYGVDLGGAVSVDRLRMLWQTLRTNEAKLLQGLRPITHVRDAGRGGRPDVRLIAGPLPNAGEAAKLCGAILAAGRYCEPAVFHGNRLSLR